MEDHPALSPVPTWRSSLKPWLWSIAAILVGLTVLQAPWLWLDAVLFAASNLLSISPVILIGALLVAAANATGTVNMIATAFAGRQIQMIIAASAIGALTPVCGIAVLPLVAGLLGAGVPLGPIMAFWLSSPITDPSMLAITAATLGLPFAIAKTIAAFGIGLFGGAITSAAVAVGRLRDPVRPNAIAAATGGACGVENDVSWTFWRDPARRSAFRANAVGTIKLMVPWLAAAFVAEFFLRAWLPPDLVADLVGAGAQWAVPLAAIVGAPIYLDGYAALPLVRGLIDAGMAPAAALSFLIAGGITSAWAIVPVFALVRLPVVCLYCALAVLGAVLAGWTAAPLLR